MEQVNIQLSRRDFALMLAGLMSAEDSPDAFQSSLRALREPAAKDREVIELGERILSQIDPGKTL